MKQEFIKNVYSKAANGGGCGCGCDDVGITAGRLGYKAEDMAFLPQGVNLGLGCGSPLSFANLQKGETVLDLGSGAGIDCFLAARDVGEAGFVYGVDMTGAMVEKAKTAANNKNMKNVDFRLGYIEELPIEDTIIDVVISNCVVNLSLEKQKVFNELFRVLKQGGRVAISDIVLTAKLPQNIQEDMAMLGGCVAGASDIYSLTQMLTNAGFSEISITPKDESREFLKEWADGIGVENYVTSAIIRAIKS